MDEPERFGETLATTYQLVLGLCLIPNCFVLIAQTMGFPTPAAGAAQMLYISGLFAVVLLYRSFPMIGAIYSVLPLVHPILGNWIALPFFFKGIRGSFFVTCIFSITAITGFVMHRIDLHNKARLAMELNEEKLSSRVKPKNRSSYIASRTIASPEYMKNVEDLPVQERDFHK